MSTPPSDRSPAPDAPSARPARHLGRPAHVVGAPRARPLSVEDCCWLLSTDMVGRICFTAGALPALAPVTYVTSGRDVLIRVEDDAELLSSLPDCVVALQVDHIDREGLVGWQVTVTGIVRSDSPIPDDQRILRLTSAVITGRTVLLT